MVHYTFSFDQLHNRCINIHPRECPGHPASYPRSCDPSRCFLHAQGGYDPDLHLYPTPLPHHKGRVACGALWEIPPNTT